MSLAVHIKIITTTINNFVVTKLCDLIVYKQLLVPMDI
jgi:hypothetical protein